MTDSGRKFSVIPSHAVKRSDHPVLLRPGHDASEQAMTVTPIMDGKKVAGIEVRCCCGSRVVIECVYDEGS